MELFNQKMLLRSFCLVWLYYSTSVPVVDAFHPAKPIVYINLYDDEITQDNPQDKLKENELITYSYTITTPKTEEIMSTKEELSKPPEVPIITTGIVEQIMHSKEESPKPTLGDEHAIKPSNMPEAGSKDLNIVDLWLGGMSPERTASDIPTTTVENSISETSDFASLQFTKCYLKAITTLIQHIMDAFFSYSEPPANTKFSESSDLDDGSSTLRKLRKRQISKEHTGLVGSSLPNVQSSTIKDAATDIATNPSPTLNEHGSSSGLHDSSLSSKENKVISSSTHPTDDVHMNAVVNLNEKANKEGKDEITLTTKHGKPIKNAHPLPTDHSTDQTDHSEDQTDHKTSLLEKPSTLAAEIVSTTGAEATDIAWPEKISFDNKEDSKPTDKNDIKSQKGPTSNEYAVLMDDTKSREENSDIQAITGGEHSNPNLIQRILEDDASSKESSTAATLMIVTGCVSVVILIAAVGVAAAYLLRNSSGLRHLIHGNQSLSSQRSAMA